MSSTSKAGSSTRRLASPKPSGIALNYRFQIATYATLHGQASGTARLDTVTKTKTIQVVEQPFTIINRT